MNVLDETYNPGLREAIKSYSQWPTIPQVGGLFVEFTQRTLWQGTVAAPSVLLGLLIEGLMIAACYLWVHLPTCVWLA